MYIGCVSTIGGDSSLWGSVFVEGVLDFMWLFGLPSSLRVVCVIVVPNDRDETIFFVVVGNDKPVC